MRDREKEGKKRRRERVEMEKKGGQRGINREGGEESEWRGAEEEERGREGGIEREKVRGMGEWGETE